VSATWKKIPGSEDPGYSINAIARWMLYRWLL